MERKSTGQAQRASSRSKSKVESLAKIFARRDAAVKRGEFDLLGRIYLVRTERGDIDFGKDGPFLAKLDPGGELALMNEWKGFPDIVTATHELCPDCQAKCLSCDGEGHRLCMGLNCGGAGRMILGYEQCPAPGCARETGKANRGCEQCEGSGKVVGQTAECPSCKGTKKQSCPLCRGTGRMSTGRKDGAPSDSNAPYCASCNGIGRKLEREPQAWNDYVLGTMEGFTVLGPIHEILLRADVCRDAKQSIELASILPDADGNLGALLVKKPETTGQPWYWLGGELGNLTRL